MSSHPLPRSDDTRPPLLLPLQIDILPYFKLSQTLPLTPLSDSAFKFAAQKQKVKGCFLSCEMEVGVEEV